MDRTNDHVEEDSAQADLLGGRTVQRANVRSRCRRDKGGRGGECLLHRTVVVRKREHGLQRRVHARDLRLSGQDCREQGSEAAEELGA